MDVYLNIAASGLLTGLVYGLAALGLSVISASCGWSISPMAR
ncbi:MAG: hypothetical protein WDO24_03955 [Pseudomonadota bacterium]